MILQIFGSLMALALANENYSADVFDLDGKNQKFTYQVERVTTGDTTQHTVTFKDMSGQVVATEKGEIVKGQLTRYEAARSQTEESGTVEVKDGKIHFSYTEKGKTSKSRDNVKPNTLFSGMLVQYVQANWADVIAKKDLPFSYVVWYRKETVGFKFVHDKAENGKIVLKMVPTNMLYRSLVDPLFFTFNATTKQLEMLKGRTLPKVQVDGKWKDFNATLIYKY